MNKRIILITGASGLIGSALSSLLIDQGHEVRQLSSNQKWVEKQANRYYWNIAQNYIDIEAIKDVDVLINLSGASIAKGLWTRKRKKILLESRVEGSRLLFESFQSSGTKLAVYFGASAIGYYGSGVNGDLFDENSPKGKGFLSDVCELWENEHLKFKEISKRIVVGRISNVISPFGGFMLPFRKISNLGVKLFMGNRQCYCSWIHIDDLIGFISIIADLEINGTINLCAGHSDWKEFQNAFYHHSGHHFIRLTIPTWMLKTMMGEMSSLIIDGNKVSGHTFKNSAYELRNVLLSKAFD